MISSGVLFGLCVAAFVAGVVDAIAGGGGLITLPALLAAGLPVNVAIATNKGQSTFGPASALVRFARAGAVDKHRAAVTFPLGLLGALGGAGVVLRVSPRALKPVVLGLLALVALVLALRRDLGVRPLAPPPRGAFILAGVIALSVGFYDGFFGPGTGTFLIMAFVSWLHDPMARASANAKVVNLASNLAALTLFALHGTVLWQVALPMAGAQALGSFTGAGLAIHRGDRFVRGVVLGVVVVLVGKLAHDLVGRR